MNNLFTYIKAIHGHETNALIANEHMRKNSYTDDGVEINEMETTYYYDNGVVIRYKIERDNVPTEQLCEECWISYEVLDSGPQQITPVRKIFYNSCQESFWLKMQASQTVASI